MTDAITYTATTLEEYVELVSRLENERLLDIALMYCIDSDPPQLRLGQHQPTAFIDARIESGQLEPKDVVPLLSKPRPVLVVDFPELHELAAAIRPRLHDEEYLILFQIDRGEESWSIRCGPYRIYKHTGTDLKTTIEGLIHELNEKPDDFSFESTDEVSEYVEFE